MARVIDKKTAFDRVRQNKFVSKLLRDDKFRVFLRNKMKEHTRTRAYSEHVCNMESPEITESSFRSTCTFSALKWAENNNYNLLEMLEQLKEMLAPVGSKKLYIYINNKKYLLSCNCNKEKSERATNFSPSKQGARYVEYQSGPHRMVRSASKLYNDSLFVFRDALPESVENRLCELFADEWKAYALSLEGDKYTLVINNDFEKIYSSEYCKGDFGSCMEDTGFEGMYHAFEGAKACSLQDKEGDVVARAILWEDVYDLRGEDYVYLDRQYASDGRRDLKELLITKVKELFEDKAFLYKPSDCSCIDSCRIWTREGDRFVDAGALRVKSSLTVADTVCYMDTFKFLDVSNGNCYTQTPEGNTANIALLETTNGEIELDREWSEYEQEYISRNEAVYSEWYDDYIWEHHAAWSERLSSYVDEDDDTLVRINGDFYTSDDSDVVYIEYDGKYHLMDDDNIVFCEDTGICTLADNAFYYEPDDSWYEYAENMPSDEDEESSNKEDDNTEDEDFIEREKSARIVVKDINGNFKEIEYPHDLLLKSEEDFLNVVELYSLRGLDWYDSRNVLRLYTEDAMAEAICKETWRANLQRQIDICKRNIEYYKKKKEVLCED